MVGAGAVHQGLALSVAPLPRLDLRQTCAPEPGRNVVLALDQINDPHNLGAILRSAAAFAVRAVVMPERRSAEQGGAVAKAASGALDTVPVVEVVNLARALDELAALGYWRVALDAGAEATVDAVPEVDDLVLVLGAEGTGVRRLVAEHCDFAARLPIAPAMDSLNVSVAAGIALYALARRRRGLRCAFQVERQEQRKSVELTEPSPAQRLGIGPLFERRSGCAPAPAGGRSAADRGIAEGGQRWSSV